MNNFIFENATKTYFGKGCVKEYLKSLCSHYGNTVMLAYGGGSVKRNGIYEEIVGFLNQAEKNIIEFPNITANPTYDKALEGAKLAREQQVDLILGVGGGSVIDCCKAISMAAVYEGRLWEDYWERAGIVHFEPLPLGVVVTAAGTGSEMNGAAAITNEETKTKAGRDYPQCNPRFALLDPLYTYSVPRRQMASGSFTILSHMMESYFSGPDGDNVSDDMAAALMKNVIRSTRIIMETPEDYTARSNLMWDAAMAQNRMLKLGKRADFACREMVYRLCAHTNCSHGEGLALLQPAHYRRIYQDSLPKFGRFAREVWGIPAAGKTQEGLADAGLEALEAFIREIGLSFTFQELGIEEPKEWKAAVSYKKIS